ncbi:lysophospholipid acyltransferase family protein [Pseudoduganella dura]|nr:lysophospholipid acyltransferase family protein [Pseudoduganella dura]GGX75829.1 1-acyl-sn-glycerol-3-phosphate acyltransferase [Pseudoduganella dura]
MRKAFLFLRSLVFTVVMAIATVIWSFVCMLAAPLPYNKRYYVTSRWNVFVIWLAKVVCGIRYEFKGYENFPDSPAIVLSKHQSAWETIFLLANLPRPLVFVFKKEILYIPFFGWGIALLRMIPIDRKQGKNAFRMVVAHGKRRLKDGQWIIMFPEGTRIPVGQAGKYKSGGTRLAIDTGVPVVPIAVNSGECWPKNSFIKYPGKITVSVGKPISSEGQTPDGMMEQVEQWIESEMRVISPHAYSAG